jgi:hypothetical protein
MIFIQENFLSENQCNELIELYNFNESMSYQYRDTYPLIVTNTHIQWVEDIHKKVEFVCKKFTNISIKLDKCEIVKWPKGSCQEYHYDPDTDVFAVIIYLNDNFDGGNTCFKFNPEIKITPERGKCLVFSNSIHLHKVEEVKNNTRYTLAYWFIR